jgi:hypothetical protein
MNVSNRLAQLCVLLAAAWFAFWACAPMLSAPTSRPMAESARGEFGLGVGGGATLDGGHLSRGQASFWTRKEFWRGRHEWGGAAQAGSPGVLSGGLFYRWNLAPEAAGTFGLQIEGGLPYFGLRLPIAVPLSMENKSWLTLQPSVAISGLSIERRVPVGYSVRVGEQTHLEQEVGVMWADGWATSGPELYGGLTWSKEF